MTPADRLFPPLSFRSLVFRLDRDPAYPGERRRGRARGHQRRPELHELPLGPAALHHGHPGAQPRSFRPARDHLRVLRRHGTHDVLQVCFQEPREPAVPVLFARAENGSVLSITSVCVDHREGTRRRVLL